MAQNRREFIKQAAAGLLTASTAIEKHPPPLPPAAWVSDEDAYWKLVRLQFPLTTKKTYLNNGTMGPSPLSVIEEMNKAQYDTDVLANYGGWEHTQKKLGTFLGTAEEEIALTMNVTQGINIVCWGLPLRKGDEVIITTHEHGGNALPWLNRAKKDGIVLKPFAPGKTAAETLENLSKQYTSRTRVVAVPHILCTQGQILPAKAIASWARSKGLFVFFDGAHGPGMLDINLRDLDCDAYASCCHKWMLAPKGTGFLYVRKDVQETLTPLFIGAGSDQGKWNMALTPPVMGPLAESAHRYYGGTMNNALFKGVDASIQFIQQIGIQRIEKRIKALSDYFHNQLLLLGDKIDLLTPSEESSRGGVTGFRIRGIEAMAFYERCQKEQIIIRQVHENGLNALRVSTHIYNQPEELDMLIGLIRSV